MFTLEIMMPLLTVTFSPAFSPILCLQTGLWESPVWFTMYLDGFVPNKGSTALYFSVKHYCGKLQATGSSPGLQWQESSLSFFSHLGPIFMALGNFSSYILWLKFRHFKEFHQRWNFFLFAVLLLFLVGFMEEKKHYNVHFHLLIIDRNLTFCLVIFAGM